MKVVLLQNVPGLGNIDDVKEVADGYARNFLFARNLAVPATKRSLSDLAGRKSRIVKEGERELFEQQTMAEKLDGWELEIKDKVSEAGVLYAAISPQRIIDELDKRGFKVSKNQVIMKPIKETGEFKAKIKFSHGIEAEIAIIVNKK